MRDRTFRWMTRNAVLCGLGFAALSALPIELKATSVPPAPAVPRAGALVLPGLPPPPPPPAAPPRLDLAGYDAWALLADGSRWLVDVGTAELSRIEAARRDGEPILWLRKGGDEYIVRDGELLRDLRRALDRQMDEVRERSAAARRQAELAGESVRQAAEQARAAAEQAERQARTMADDLERRLVPLEQELREDLETRLEEMAVRLEADAARLEALQEAHAGRWQELAREGEAFAREAERAGAELGRRLGEEIDRAIESGEAQPFD